MGYVNSYNHTQSFTDTEWTGIVTDVRKMFAALPAVTPDAGIPGSGGEILQIDDQEGNPPIANEKEIFFNGCGYEGADHETFQITKKAGSDFCKTARAPYDLAVQACLLIACYHAPGSIKISSDGDPEEWLAAAKLVADIGVPVLSITNCARLATNDNLLGEIAILILKEANNVQNRHTT